MGVTLRRRAGKPCDDAWWCGGWCQWSELSVSRNRPRFKRACGSIVSLSFLRMDQSGWAGPNGAMDLVPNGRACHWRTPPTWAIIWLICLSSMMACAAGKSPPTRMQPWTGRTSKRSAALILVDDTKSRQVDPVVAGGTMILTNVDACRRQARCWLLSSRY